LKGKEIISVRRGAEVGRRKEKLTSQTIPGIVPNERYKKFTQITPGYLNVNKN
jgi:hypothetical protein